MLSQRYSGRVVGCLLVSCFAHASAASEVAKTSGSQPAHFAPSISAAKRGETPASVLKIVKLVDGLGRLRKAGDQFTSADERRTKEQAFVASILGPTQVVEFEFASIPGDAGRSVPATGATWMASQYYVKYDTEKHTLATPPALDGHYFHWWAGEVQAPTGARYATFPTVSLWETWKGSTYRGQNAYGASTKVDYTSYRHIGILMPDLDQRVLVSTENAPATVELPANEARSAVKRLVWRMKVEIVSEADGTIKVLQRSSHKAPTFAEPREIDNEWLFLRARVLDLRIVDPKTSLVFYEFSAPAHNTSLEPK